MDCTSSIGNCHVFKLKSVIEDVGIVIVFFFHSNLFIFNFSQRIYLITINYWLFRTRNWRTSLSNEVSLFLFFLTSMLVKIALNSHGYHNTNLHFWDITHIMSPCASPCFQHSSCRINLTGSRKILVSETRDVRKTCNSFLAITCNIEIQKRHRIIFSAPGAFSSVAKEYFHVWNTNGIWNLII